MLFSAATSSPYELRSDTVEFIVKFVEMKWYNAENGTNFEGRHSKFFRGKFKKTKIFGTFSKTKTFNDELTSLHLSVRVCKNVKKKHK